VASKPAWPRVLFRKAFGACHFWENRSFWESYRRPVASAQRSGGRNKAESRKQKADPSTSRPDAPEFSAKEKIGSLRSLRLRSGQAG